MKNLILIVFLAISFWGNSQENKNRHLLDIVNKLLLDKNTVTIFKDDISKSNFVLEKDKISSLDKNELIQISLPTTDDKTEIYLLYLNSDDFFDLYIVLDLNYFKRSKAIELKNEGSCCNLNQLLVYLIRDKTNNLLLSIDTKVSVCINKMDTIEISGLTSEFITNTVTVLDINNFQPILSGTSVHCTEVPVEEYCIYSFSNKKEINYKKYIIYSNDDGFTQIPYKNLLKKINEIESIKEKDQVSNKNLCGACFCMPGIMAIFDRQ